MLGQLDLRGRAGEAPAAWALPRPRVADTTAEAVTVREVIADVRARGDVALCELTRRFDGAAVGPAGLRVPPGALGAALDALPSRLRSAFEEARSNIAGYHRQQLRAEAVVRRDGLVLQDIYRPVQRAGIYVPGGQAPLASTVLMTAVPARVAGVAEVIVCTPPDRRGEVAAEILAAAALAGVDEVYAVGGAQAVAAMAYGTESIRAVDVIAGPGNIYVSLAKREVAGVVGVASAFSGPSEVVVVADDTTPPLYAAADLLVQVEHGPNSVAWLLTWSREAAARIGDAVAKLCAGAARREVIEANLAANGYAVIVDGPEHALAVANELAPEHLELMCADADALVPLVRHAGAVFCGLYAPASLGDYLAGPSHVLPTFGSARFAGGLSVDDFVKRVHVVSTDAPGLARLAPHIEAMAEAEGLSAHAESVRVRAGSASS